MGIFQDLNEGLQHHGGGGTRFGFSGAKLENLGATEYTLVDIVVDTSGSTSPFQAEMEKVLKFAVASCRHSDRADNLLLRVSHFSDQVTEGHGYKPLMDCKEDDYTGILRCGGSTALFDGTYQALKALQTYGKTLTTQDYKVNGTIFVITDGQNNTGTATAKMVADALKDIRTGEAMESIMPVLIGVNVTPDLDSYLSDFMSQANFQQYVALQKADAKTLAKLGAFISQSISSQSKALGTGGPSKSLTF